MKNSKRRTNKFIETSFNLMELFTEIIKNSLVFWLYFMRGFGFLTMLSASESLIFVSEDILDNKRIKTLKNFKNKYLNTNKKRLISIFIFFFLFYSILFFLWPISEEYSGALIYTVKYCILVMSILLFLLVLTRPLLKKQFNGINWSLFVHVFLLIRGYWWTLLMIISLSIIIYFSFKNFIFLVFVFPGVTGLIISFFISKIIRKIQHKYINK